MSRNTKNLCIRCGTQRVAKRTWKEKVGVSIVTVQEMSCPDSDCQKKVEKDNKKQTDKYAAIKEMSERRAVDRKAAKDALRMAKVH